MDRTINYIRNDQESDGSWFGRCGTNYIYGTWSVLMGLEQTHLPKTDPMYRKAVQWLQSVQREDGGWSQLSTMGSDAYASGQALFALNAAGRMAVSDPIFRKGIGYLLRTQHADGSWQVATRSIWVQPYFASGFPHGHNQWVSTAGTSWAVMALSLTQPQAVTRLNE